jgi:hypothetical protein
MHRSKLQKSYNFCHYKKNFNFFLLAKKEKITTPLHSDDTDKKNEFDLKQTHDKHSTHSSG